MLDSALESLTGIGEKNITPYRTAMEGALRHACAWLSQGTLYTGETPQQLRKRLQELEVFPREGVGDELALADAAEVILENSLQVHHPLCVAHLHCPTTVAAQGAEVLLNVANQSMDSWDQSPAATVLEQHLLEWLRDKVGYAMGDAGVFTSGGTQSNLMGLLLARDQAINHHWQRSARENGLPEDARRLKVICSEKAHFSVRQALYLLGLGAQACISVPVDRYDRIDLSAAAATLNDARNRGDIVFAIVATAGTTDAGAIDPLGGLADFAATYGIWLHVDAAWGGALLLSSRYRDQLQGIERADSVTLDFHKHFFQPISCSAFLLKDEQKFDLMREHADYLNPTEDDALGIPNLVGRSLQTTRRFDALKLWVSLRSIGEQRFANLIDAGVDLARTAAEELGKEAVFEVVQAPQISSVLFKIRAPELSDQQCDTLHQTIALDLLNDGIANLGVSRRNGRSLLKMTLLNPATNLSDIRDLAQHLKRMARDFIARVPDQIGCGLLK